MTPQIMIGTAGYAYAEWVKVFYPPDLPKADWLDHYSRHFNFLELNFSYYRLPGEQQMEHFLQYPLKFAIKGHRSLTHDRVDTPQARQDFLKSVRLLDQENHLAAVLLQFPYSFAYSAGNRKYLFKLLEDLGGLPLVVEFRQPDWIRDSVFRELQQRGWGISMLDSPVVKGGMPVFEAVTSDIAYLRFHGRNRENWWSGDNVSRYDYLYSRDELKEWLPRIMAMANQAKTTYISFNNHAGGQAVKNAMQLMKMIED